jgi:putative transposase
MSNAPELASGDGALEFWRAIDKVLPTARYQRCWVHKIANVSGKLLKHTHGKAKARLQHVRLQTVKIRNCVSRRTILTRAFKLSESTQ